jgi:D-alanyl-lipoteichoic acid acyltransferase DltB (MBOAT superfamily)
VSFFPQLVAGPIERATNLLPQFTKPRAFDYETGVDGMRQILWGFFKKIVVADNCAVFVERVFSNHQFETGSSLLLAAVLFAFQIYGDFSGYSDIAIGTSKLFGIKLMRNFNVPYFSRDIAEFWRRWHISLTTWFRDYVYIPLGGSRCSKAKIVRNTFVIFLLSGFWHGANWTFIAWGAYHALLFLPLILMGKNRKYRDNVAEGRLLPTLKELGQMLLTFLLVVIGWIIFRAETIGDACEIYSKMLHWGTLRAFYRCITMWQVRTPFLLSFLMLSIEWIQRKVEHGLQFSTHLPWFLRYPIYLGIILLIICFFSQPVTFVYFQF